MPLFLEYCSGNGEWVVDQALLHPHILWIAIEKRKDRAYQIRKRKMRLGADHLSVVAQEGYFFTKSFLLTDSVDRIFINFPDPWPKRRHATNRLMQPAFLQEVARVLKKGGTLQFTTDDTSYFQLALQLCAASDGFHPPLRKKGTGSSFFERLWLEKGREIHTFEVTKW